MLQSVGHLCGDPRPLHRHSDQQADLRAAQSAHDRRHPAHAQAGAVRAAACRTFDRMSRFKGAATRSPVPAMSSRRFPLTSHALRTRSFLRPARRLLSALILAGSLAAGEAAAQSAVKVLVNDEPITTYD